MSPPIQRPPKLVTNDPRGGATSKLQFFLIVSTCLLYLVAAGLFSRAIWYFQAQDWNNAVGGDAAEVGSGPGSYDIDQSVWHVNASSPPSFPTPHLTPHLQFGNPELNGGGGWGIFNAILGWQNSATYGSVISYNVYWIAVIIGFVVMRYKETKGHLPFMKTKKHNDETMSNDGSSGVVERSSDDKTMPKKTVPTTERMTSGSS